VIGGLIVHYLHWSMVFLVNLPVGALGLFMVWRFLPDYRQDKHHALDIVGFILFGAGIALLSYVLEVFGEHRETGSRHAQACGSQVVGGVFHVLHLRLLN